MPWPAQAFDRSGDKSFPWRARAALPTFKIHQAGYHNVAALMGSRLSDRQAELVGTYFDHVVLMLDGDEAGNAGTIAAATVLSPIVAVETVELARGAQPDQLASEEISQVLGGFAHDLSTPDR